MFPDVGRELLGEGVFDTRGHRYALLLQGPAASTGAPALGTAELNTAWASARGQLNAALHVSASAPSARLREVQVSMTAAAKDGGSRIPFEQKEPDYLLLCALGLLPLEFCNVGAHLLVAYYCN
jgi:hypothetical protein